MTMHRQGIPMGSISEETIHALVHGFYGKVRADPHLAAIFDREIDKDEWPAHLDKMCAFWSSVLLRSGRYEGRPMRPHLQIRDIDDIHFRRWLTLSAETARAVFDEADANGIIATAERIGQNFRLGRAQTATLPPPSRRRPRRVSPPAGGPGHS